MECEREIADLNRLANEHYAEGRRAEAMETARQSYQLATNRLTPDHPLLADSINNLAALSDALGDGATAERLYLEVIQCLRRLGAGQRKRLSVALSSLASLYESQQRFAQAEALLTQALEIRQAVLTRGDPSIARSVQNLAVLYEAQDKTHHADELLRQHERRGSHSLAGDPSFIPRALTADAQRFDAEAKYGIADVLYRAAVKSAARRLGSQNLLFMAACNNLALLCEKLGNFAEAFDLYVETLGLLDELHTPASPGNGPASSGDGVSEDGNTRNCSDEYDESQLLLFRGQIHNNLGFLRFKTGDLAGADDDLRHALDIRRAVPGTPPDAIAESLNNLGMLTVAMGDYEAAVQLFCEALARGGEIFTEGHPRIANILNNLGAAASAQGDLVRAIELYQRAVDLRVSLFGHSHPAVAESLNNLGAIYWRDGHFKEAERLLLEAQQIREQFYGPSHPDVAATLNNLGTLAIDMGAFDVARDRLQRALITTRVSVGSRHPDVVRILANLALVSASSGNRSEARTLLASAVEIQDEYIDEVFTIATERQRLAHMASVRIVFDGYLSLLIESLDGDPDLGHQAFLLTMRRKGLVAHASMDARIAAAEERHPEAAGLLRQLGETRRTLARRKMDQSSPPDDATCEALIARRDELEAELARTLPSIGTSDRLADTFDPSQVEAVAGGAVILEYIRYLPLRAGPAPRSGSERWAPPRYAVFVISQSEWPTVACIDLGPAESIDTAVQDFLHHVSSGSDAFRGTGDALRRLVIDPIADRLRGTERLLIAPDADLAGIPFEPIVLPDGQLLVDQFEISYLTTARDLRRFDNTPASRGNPPIVVADPDFDADENPEDERDRDAARARSMLCGTATFPRLPGTLKEGTAVAQIHAVRAVVGTEATKSCVLDVASPSVLHIASHGFVVELPDSEPVTTLTETTAESPLQDPMLRSGIALAGANTWLSGGMPPEDAGNGILTAEEVTAMNLLETGLVVLSACDTGRGQIRAGEGVFGLQRAFLVAGARCLLTSLWKVPDDPTAALMTEFHRRLRAGNSKTEALRRARQKVRAEYPHPADWAAFVLVGDPAPVYTPAPDRKTTDL